MPLLRSLRLACAYIESPSCNTHYSPRRVCIPLQASHWHTNMQVRSQRSPTRPLVMTIRQSLGTATARPHKQSELCATSLQHTAERRMHPKRRVVRKCNNLPSVRELPCSSVPSRSARIQLQALYWHPYEVHPMVFDPNCWWDLVIMPLFRSGRLRGACIPMRRLLFWTGPEP